MFDPEPAYDIKPKAIPIRDFHDYREEFVTRPPYQRKNVWSRRKKQSLLDSLFRRFYVPKVVLREVRLSEKATRLEVIDGQQRITAAQEFLSDQLPLPKSLASLDPKLPGKRFSNLPADLRRFVDREIVYDADLIKRIDDPLDPGHQRIATEIFWRLQQGESLNTMEVAHARLASLVRNFLVKYADDQRFDFEAYQPVDENPDKHPFFAIVDRPNERMQHLALLARLLLLERKGGPAEIRDKDVVEFIDEAQVDGGIGNESYEDQENARGVLGNLQMLTDLFSDDPIIKGGGTVKELRIEYFIVSVYLLLHHIRKWYVFGEDEKGLLKKFILSFHERWRRRAESDSDVLIFSDNRQQSAAEIATRDRILRQLFFEFAEQEGQPLKDKDKKRAFNEAERIAIYRRDEGLCQECLAEEKPEKECEVGWTEFEADHVVPHSRGGKTVVENGQVLCRVHNRRKGATLAENPRAGSPEAD